MENNRFIKLIKKRILVIISLLTVLILLFTASILLMSHNNKNEYILIDIFGRQRMITQMITKDINRKYNILQSIQRGPLVESKETLNKKIDLLNDSLKKATDEFGMTFDSLHSGVLETKNITINLDKSIKNMEPAVQETESQWVEFKKSVEIMMNSNQVDQSTTKALIFINSSNEQLLTYCDKLTQGLISSQKKGQNINIFIAFGLCLLSLVLLIFSILNLERYIVNPINELYKEINNFGLLKKDFNKIPVKNGMAPVLEDVNIGVNKLNKLIELIQNINQDISFDGILKYIYFSFSDFIPYSHIGIAMIKESEGMLEASYGISDAELSDLPKKLYGLKAYIAETSLGRVITEGAPRVINDLETYTANSHNEYNKILLEAGIRSSIALPLKISNKPVGVIFFSAMEKEIYEHQHITFLETLSDSIAISLKNNIFIYELLYSTILALAKMAEARDEDTGEHLERMKQYSVMITQCLLEDKIYEDEITIDFIKDIERFSPMHDIGKVGIRDGVLLKPGKLTNEEFDIMKMHTIYGAEVLKTAEKNIKKQNKSLFKMGIEITMGHHEKWDGSGYPYHKSGQDIPLSARIVAVADVFDALASKRPYKEPFSFEESFQIIMDGKGKHFDPDIVDTFVRHRDDIYRLYLSFNSSYGLNKESKEDKAFLAI
ncbi:MAG: metal dependent phosphohydrolase [Oscillospiraceae bacterium]|nr:metal dependent phosphohydrolase [Oscillospiraceae bacterium]